MRKSLIVYAAQILRCASFYEWVRATARKTAFVGTGASAPRPDKCDAGLSRTGRNHGNHLVQPPCGMAQRRTLSAIFSVLNHPPQPERAKTDHLGKIPDPLCGAVWQGGRPRSDHPLLSRCTEIDRWVQLGRWAKRRGEIPATEAERRPADRGGVVGLPNIPGGT